MKKLLGIVVLGLFFCHISYANTPVQQYVFEKLYDEYSKCTVYYKFLSRGVERKNDVGTLTEKEKSFVNEMNILSEEAEKNVYFFSSKISISNEDIQSNIQNIYKTFLDIAGRDYSKTELLNEKYYVLCSNSLKDTKSRMVYWDTEFQKIANETKPKKDNDLSNVKLECLSNKEDSELIYYYFHFLDSNTAKLYEFSPYSYKISTDTMDYVAELTEIKLTSKPDKNKVTEDKMIISRKNLNLKIYAFSYQKWWDWWDCKILDDNFKIMNHLKLIQKNKLEERAL